MARIPIYQQQTSASQAGLGAGPVRNPGVEAAGLQAIGGAVADMQQAKQRREEEDASTWVTGELANEQAYWNAQVIERKQAAAAGAPEFTPTLLNDYDARTKELLDKAPTRASRQFLQQRLAAFRGSLQQDAMVFQAGAAADQAVSTVRNATDQKRQVVQIRPEQFDTMLAEQTVLIDAMRLPEPRKIQLRQDAKDALARDAVLGTIERNPYQALKALTTEPGKSGVTAVESLNADDRLQLRAAAEAEIRRREADARARQVQQREGLQTAEEDAFAAKANGLPASLPTRAQYVAAYGEDGAKRYSQSSKLFSLYDSVGAIVTAPPAEAAAALANLKPTQQEGAAAQSRVLEQAGKLYDRQRKQFEQDPAGYLTRQDLALGGLWQATANGDQTATGEYIARVRAQQQAAGIAKPHILPSAAADSLATALTFDPDKPGQRSANLQSLATQWGQYYPQVIRELSPKLEGEARILAAMRPDEAKKYDQVLAQGRQTIFENVPSKDKQKLLAEVQTALRPLTETLLWAPDGETRINEHLNAASLLAASYVNHGVDPETAAQRAALVIANERYDYRDTARIPHPVDADQVTGAAEVAKASLKPDELAVRPTRFMGEAEAQQQLAARITRDGFWITAGDESGLDLMLTLNDGSSVPVVRKDGRRVRYTWDQLAAMPTRAAGAAASPYTMQGAK